MAGVQTISEYFPVYYFLMYLIRNKTHLRPIQAVWAREACLRERLLLFAVVGMVVKDGDGAVELFGQQDAHHAVREGEDGDVHGVPWSDGVV